MLKNINYIIIQQVYNYVSLYFLNFSVGTLCQIWMEKNGYAFCSNKLFHNEKEIYFHMNFILLKIF